MHEIRAAGPERPSSSPGLCKMPVLRKLDSLRKKFGLSGTLPDQSHIAATVFARRIQEKLCQSQSDILFSPAGSALISRLETDLPVVYSSSRRLFIGCDSPTGGKLLSGIFRPVGALPSSG
jgi:hypothetical protein